MVPRVLLHVEQRRFAIHALLVILLLLLGGPNLPKAFRVDDFLFIMSDFLLLYNVESLRFDWIIL